MATMPAILADHDVEGQVAVLLSIWTSSEWHALWEGMCCAVQTFAGLGIATTIPDSELWQICQDRQFVLITGNRNADTEDSLEETIQRRSQPVSLPVLTIGDPARLMTDRAYAEAAAVKALDFLLDIENLRGAQRLFIP
jgi:hypothetical protein